MDQEPPQKDVVEKEKTTHEPYWVKNESSDESVAESWTGIVSVYNSVTEHPVRSGNSLSSNSSSVSETEADNSAVVIKKTCGPILSEEDKPPKQSEAVRRAWNRVMQHLHLFNCKDPLTYELYGKTTDEIRDLIRLPEEDVNDFEAENWEPKILAQEYDIFQMEAQEKLFGRFRIYQKALMYMAEHFETLRPLLAEIKQAYEEVLEKCENEWKDFDNERLDQLRLKEAYAAYVRQKDTDGDRALMEVRVQAFTLQEHLQWQQHTLYTILGMLWKMRQSLEMQNRLVKKTEVIYKTKIEALAKEIVSQQGQAMFEMTLPGKYTEIMNRFKQTKDPLEVRRILQSARRQLRKLNKKLVSFEADYADTIPKTEYDIYMKKYTIIHTKNSTVNAKCDVLKAEIERLKESIAKKNTAIYEEVGLDELTGQPFVILPVPTIVEELIEG